MALQIPPLAFVALRYGTVAIAGYAAARFAQRGRFSPAVEAEMDAAPEGVHVVKDDGRLSGSARIVRDWSVRGLTPRFRVDATALGRLKIRRLT